MLGKAGSAFTILSVRLAQNKGLSTGGFPVLSFSLIFYEKSCCVKSLACVI
jgi:hypothetical protein